MIFNDIVKDIQKEVVGKIVSGKFCDFCTLFERKKRGKRYEARSWALIFRHLGFLSLGNAQTMEPTTAWTAVSSPCGSTGYSFLHLSGVGRALWRTVVKAQLGGPVRWE